MKSIQILVFCLIFSSGIFNHLQAGIFNETTGGRSAALGYTSICHYDFWSAINNQAGLAFINRLSGGVFVENKFLLKSLSTKSFALALPVSNGTIGFSLIRFGETAYNETALGLSYGMMLTKYLSIGIQLFHYSINQSYDLGKAGTLSFQGGFIYEHADKIRIGFHIFSPEFITKHSNKPDLPEIIKLGLNYRFTETLNGFLEVQSHSKLGNGINSGIEYHSTNNFAFRIGYSSINEKLTFGIGIKLKKLIIDLASSMHNVLGYSPQLSLTYKF